MFVYQELWIPLIATQLNKTRERILSKVRIAEVILDCALSKQLLGMNNLA